MSIKDQLYQAKDSGCWGSPTSLSNAYQEALEWYRDGGWSDQLLAAANAVPIPTDIPRDLDHANNILARYLDQIAHELEIDTVAGHGSYYVPARSRAGLDVMIYEADHD